MPRFLQIALASFGTGVLAAACAWWAMLWNLPESDHARESPILGALLYAVPVGFVVSLIAYPFAWWCLFRAELRYALPFVATIVLTVALLPALWAGFALVAAPITFVAGCGALLFVRLTKVFPAPRPRRWKAG